MKIVIVDGDREAGKFIKDCLMTLHFDCEIAGNERDGLKTALREDCVCVITEVVLPGRDGIHLCSEIRKERDIPIIFISSEGGDASKVRAFGAGADDYITKPFSMRELLARVRTNMRRAASMAPAAPEEPGDQIRAKDITIDRTRRAVYKNGKELELTQREYELIKFLAENPGRVMSREELMGSVWQYDYFGDLRAVDVAVRRLREKLEDNPSEPVYVMTKRGAGYYFAD